MKIRLENTTDGHDKYWEYCTIKGTDMSLVTWGPRGLFKNKPKVNGRQIVKTDEAKRKKNQKMSKGYKINYENDKGAIYKIIVPKRTEMMLVYNDGTDTSFVSEVETKYDPTDIEQMESFSIDDVVTFILPVNNKNASKIKVMGSKLKFMEN